VTRLFFNDLIYPHCSDHKIDKRFHVLSFGFREENQIFHNYETNYFAPIPLKTEMEEISQLIKAPYQIEHFFQNYQLIGDIIRDCIIQSPSKLIQTVSTAFNSNFFNTFGNENWDKILIPDRSKIYLIATCVPSTDNLSKYSIQFTTSNINTFLRNQFSESKNQKKPTLSSFLSSKNLNALILENFLGKFLNMILLIMV
jgi:hypothetical protein